MVIDLERRRVGRLVDTLYYDRSKLISLKNPFKLLHLTVNRQEEEQLHSLTVLEAENRGLSPIAFMGINIMFHPQVRAVLSGVNLNELATEVGGIKVVRLDQNIIIPVSHTMFDDYDKGDVALAVRHDRRLRGWGTFLIQLAAQLAVQKGAGRLENPGDEDTTVKHTSSGQSLYETALKRKKMEAGSLNWYIDLLSALPHGSILEKLPDVV